MPLQANVEDVLSQDEKEMYQCLMDQTKVKSTWGGQKASLAGGGGGWAGGCAGCVA